MEVVLILFQAFFSGFPIIYAFLNITNRKRFPDWICYVIGTFLLGLSGINNCFFSFAPSVVFVVIVFMIVFGLSRDKILKKVLIIVAFSLFMIVSELIVAIIMAPLEINRNTDPYAEYVVSLSSVLLPDLLMIAVLFYRRKIIKKILLPCIMLIVFPVLIGVYTMAILLDKGQQDTNVFLFAGAMCAAINLVFVLTLMLFIEHTKNNYDLDKEISITSQITAFDKEYFELVQKEIEKERFLRHDVVNYLEQIRYLSNCNEPSSRELALKLITELEDRLSSSN